MPGVLNNFLTKIVGSKGERDIRRLREDVARINELEEGVAALDDAGLRARTAEFRTRLDQGAGPDDILHEAFAVVREVGKRVLHMRHFDVQLIGGMVLHQGKIAEMKTGEGKTLVATLPAYLNALTGEGVHVVTVNDYLARRDAEWMGRIYRALGLSVGLIQHDMPEADRKIAYGSDVTYGTNNEFGFDYLRDNMKYSLASMVQRGFHFAIVDEVDSILIDEARTPLIISGPAEASTELYYQVDRIIPRLNAGAVIREGKLHEIEAAEGGDYIVDEKARTVTLTEEGVAHAEKLLGVENLYDPSNMHILHHVNQSLRAHTLFQKDVDYMLKEGQVVIVDEFTGRLMPGRRWSDGLHQAVEAKEGVKIERENQTLATVTFQNFFRMYDKLSGMTGTADTEAVEFDKIYSLEVVVIPTNRPLRRLEYPDVVYRTEGEKFTAATEEIAELHGSGQPVLVGTISIEKSEVLSVLLKKRGIPHVVLNAKYHEKEAEIVAQAGRLGAVTIATNMAGRGTDILLGGNPEGMVGKLLLEEGTEPSESTPEQQEAALERARGITEAEKEQVRELGGLHILGTERHESRRIDNQLRGRSGRQGDPGSSRFYVSLQDDLMRIFGGERLQNVMLKLGMEEGVPIEHGMVSRSIERAQKQVEGRNFETRKHLLEYDDVMNKQREEIYALRRDVLGGERTRDYILQKTEEIVDYLREAHAGADVDPGDWEVDELRSQVTFFFGIDLEQEKVDFGTITSDGLRETILDLARRRYEAKEAAIGPERMRFHEKVVLLNIIDTQWKDHLLSMDHLKDGIGLRGYGQRDPLNEYKRESFELFREMTERIENECVRYLYLLEPPSQEDQERQERRRREQQRQIVFSGPAAAKPVRKAAAGEKKVGRNDPCPCGSGKKFKKCHGA
ncbi:MAG: preprotein translocase subunit SecA [Acidobacteriota bacterium]